MITSPEFYDQTITKAQYDKISASLDRPITDFLFQGNRSRYFPTGMSGEGSAALDRNRLLGQPNGR